jgi:nucleoside-diphosphate-sugar epimerase
MRGETLPITGTGEETRDFTYVGDIVEGMLRAGYYEEAIGQEMNVASWVETRIIDVATMINELTGNTAGIRCVERRKWDTKSRLLASVERAKQVIGYEPKVPFVEGLKTTIAWFREYCEQIERSASFGPGMSSAVRSFVSK